MSSIMGRTNLFRSSFHPRTAVRTMGSAPAKSVVMDANIVTLDYADLLAGKDLVKSIEKGHPCRISHQLFF